jgi:anti-anti-sigma factor
MSTNSLDHMRLSITTSADSSVDFVRILGDVDLSDSRQLGLAAKQLTTASLIYVDLGGTTFMGSTLAEFLLDVGTSARMRRPLVLCRPTSAARRVIHMTGLDELARVQSDLPRAWPGGAGGPDATSDHPSARSYVS